jgi:hypothetical protein
MRFAFSLMAAAAALALTSSAFAAAPEAPKPSPITPPSSLSVPDSSATLGASDESGPAKPTACETYKPDPKSKAVGRWSLRQRDDGQDWAGPWDIELRANGSWTQASENAGFWCQDDKLIVFGFSEDPHTTYRGEIGLSGKFKGIESWNGGGTGIFEAEKRK